MTSNAAFNQKEFKIVWIPMCQLSVVWVESQRPLDERFAQSIAADFDDAKFGTLAITQVNGDGMHHIIDGQHRKRGAEIFLGDPMQKLPCQMLKASNPAEAATLFEQINSKRKAPNQIDFFRVRVTAGVDDYVTVNQIVIDNGYHIGSNTSDGGRGISCVQTLLMIKRSHGDDVLDHTLKILHASWGYDRSAQVAPIITGIGMFLSEFREKANWQQIVSSIRKKYTPGQLIGAAKTWREVNGRTLAVAIKALLIAAYNKGYPKSKHLHEEEESEDEDELVA